MSVITDILDRLSGIAAVRERLAETAKRVDLLADRLLDHERRLTRVETLLASGSHKGGRMQRKK